MKIVIVGLGVIGGSYAMALKEAGYDDVWGIDIDEKTIQIAKNLEVIRNGVIEENEILKTADLIILSIYPALIKDFIIKNKDNFKDGAVITDTTGIKGLFIEEVINILPRTVDFVFGHPMAGREKKGIEFASSKVFKAANYLIVKTDINKEESIELVENLVLSIGFKSVKRMTSKFHDEIIAFTSQLPHVLAVALINSDENDRETGRFVGDSYKELTRIANINEDLWCELFMGNRDNLLSTIDNFSKELNKIKLSLENGDDSSLISLFKKSSYRREQL